MDYEFPSKRTDESDELWKIIEELKAWQTIPAQEPISAEKYETAINRILNDMGNSTYCVIPELITGN